MRRSILLASALLILLFSSTQRELQAEEEVSRQIVPKAHEQIYTIKGNNFILMSSEVRVTDGMFGAEVDPKRYSIGSKNPAAINLSRLPMGFEFVFVHPKYLGFKKVKDTLSFTLTPDIRLLKGAIPNQPFKLNVTLLKMNNNGWNLRCQLAKEIQGTTISNNRIFLGEKFETNYIYKSFTLQDFSLDINVEFDEKMQRVKTADLNYHWKLDKAFNNYPNHTIDLRTKGKKPKGEKLPDNYNVHVSFNKEIKSAISYEERVQRAIDMSKSYLWGFVRDSMINYKSRSQGSHSKIQSAGHTQDTEVAEIALALFALFRSGLDPEDKEVETLLYQFMEMSGSHTGGKIGT
jgi:hypothetical protein